MVTQHAIRVRLADVSAMVDRPRSVRAARLWVEDVSAAAAERRLATELARPATGTRCVLLRRPDGRADLVVVATRSRSVAGLAAELLGLPVPSHEAAVVDEVDADPPEWGLGDGVGTSTHFQAAVAGEVDEPAWRRALSVTLDHYGETPAVGLVFDPEPDLPDAEYIPFLTPPFPLTISVRSGQLRCDYRLSHFTPAVVEQFARHLVHVCRQIRDGHPDPALLDDAERARIVALGRSPVRLDSTPTGLHHAFDRVAAANPDAIALCDNDVRLTYRELGERAERLAGGLRAREIGHGDKVMVCLDRTAELVVTLLGVLKAGACYVPVDPAYPAERLAYTAQDADAVLAVTRFPQFLGDVPTVTPTELAGSPYSSEVDSPGDPAYVIYTSGSSGRPKGVVVPHRNVISLIDATRDEYRLGPGDAWTLFHSSAFDFSVWEIWGCLLTGGRLVVVSYADSRDPERFRDLLVAEGVSVLSQTPSAFAQLLEVDHAGAPVRLVVFGGEPLDASILLRWFDRHPESVCRVVNMFGITETTVHVTAQTYTRAMALAGSRSVGPALPGWHVYVLDQAGRLLPPGVAGEIHVGGAGVASGYLNRPELTASRFVPDPYAGGVMYRSGDLGRLLPDGSLHHLGRIDSQVKIRGFRIELDEIRSVLLEDPAVRAAAVVVRQADSAAARIDAYVVPETLDPAAVRNRAASVLPDYMVPATVTAMSALPLTTNGKLDSANLPAPIVSTRSGPPTDDDDLALVLREVWSEVFGAPVGLDDDFYHLGGNSLLAVRISAAMRSRGLPPVKLRDLFRTPTIRAVLSAHASSTNSTGDR